MRCAGVGIGVCAFAELEVGRHVGCLARATVEARLACVAFWCWSTAAIGGGERYAKPWMASCGMAVADVVACEVDAGHGG